MKLSKLAWNRSKNVYDAIIQHPFNQELMKGTLKEEVFAYYIEQDGLYLNDFSRCQAIIASKIPTEYIGSFLKFSKSAFIGEQELVHLFFKKIFSLKETGNLAPATIGYTNYLLRLAITEPVEVAVAAILPCLWIYREIGLHIYKNTTENNPYERWIETYSMNEFKTPVLEAIDIFDELASKTTEAIRQRMIHHFHLSTCYEWHFWNDAYLMRVFDDIHVEQGVCGVSCCQ